ncbi:uncharacterized protein LOC112085447 [Eutrema salsugineum]|uniref:uncharacterized protein LOC112085447 n=1 Tax=Eutrema salsugineum TaxID=72664 RepID=UPI000CECECC8|nr:uncharacterized protein LOC112085447 [Eutrema salsugineum]
MTICEDNPTQVGGHIGEDVHSPVRPQPDMQQTRAEPSLSTETRHVSTAAFDPTTLMNAFAAQMQELVRSNDAKFTTLTAQISSLQQESPLRRRNLISDFQGERDPQHTAARSVIQQQQQFESPSQQVRAQPTARDLEIERMQAQLREISSKFHQANSSAPDIDRIIQEAQKTPFTSRITNVPVPNLEKFKLRSYEGNSDPRHFLTSFGIVVADCTVDDAAALEALYQKTWYKSPFHKELRRNRPLTLEDALHKSNLFIAEEEEEAAKDRQYSASKPDQTLTVEDNSETKTQSGKQRGVVNQAGPSKHKSGRPPKSWNTWNREDDTPLSECFCEYHERYGHSTKECRHLRDFLLQQFRKGEVATTDLPKPGPRRPNLRQNKPGNQETAKAAKSDEEQATPPKRDREAPKRETNVPKTRKKVNMIMGALESCNYSVRALKEYSRQASSSQPQTTVATVPLLFTNADLRGVYMPHNDCLVVELQLGDVEVSRILIDTGSSVNVIFKETRTVGTVKIPIYVGGSARMIKFLVLNKPAIYNAILGTCWLFDMKAAASTFHQCVKFPTPSGIYTLKGSQTASRLCHLTECKLSLAQTCVISPFQEDRAAAVSQFGPPKQSRVEQVGIDPTDPERYVGIGAELDNNIREALISFLQKNKRRKLGPEKARAANDEVEKLLKAGLITEVRYPDWLANPVVVKKKNGKWRICVDFTDLNTACPKDSFALPHIDCLVEATAGNELLSFMDAFSGYNQILMHPDDREKTSFITDRGIYCYKVMSFGLKNVGATYQRLVNRMFASQLGKTMEVYIDDMLVKSLYAKDHIAHLSTCFNILNEYAGDFLGYIVTERGIEANPKQISAVLDLPSPTSRREVQKLTGRIAALNRFISRSTDKCLPFYQLLRDNKHHTWSAECEDAFKQLKTIQISNLRKLALAVVVSARKLRPYFQSHSITVLTDQPLRTILHSPSQSGRLAKWAVELSEYEMEYKNRTSAKFQVLADFLIELPKEFVVEQPPHELWTLHVDGSSSHRGSGVGIRLKSPNGEILEQSFRLEFPASNNESEYKALLAGLRLAKELGVKHLHAFCDSQLVASQLSGEYTTKNDRMDAYLRATKTLILEFETFKLTKIPRGENSSADALAALASSSDPHMKRKIPVESIYEPSIKTVQECNVATQRRNYDENPNPIPPKMQ